jgi:tetratricopeptide (TPR) repeat protein
MTYSPGRAFGVDVFIVFSKKVVGEAKLAFAIKDELEQLGLQPLEYEHWTSILESLEGSGSPDADSAWGGEIDRAALRALFDSSAAVVYIAPLSGEASKGVEVELAELRGCGSPTLLVYWSPFGWHPLLEPDRVAGLNLIWRTEATSAGATDIAQNQAASVARQVAGACWLAAVLRSLPHDGLIRHWLKALAPDSADALLRFRLTAADDDAAALVIDDAPDLATSARRCADECTREELAAFLRAWRNGTDLMTEVLAGELRYGIALSMRVLYRSCEALCRAALDSFPEFAALRWEDQLSRAEMLVRLNRNDEATELLTKVPMHIPEEGGPSSAQLLAFAAEGNLATTAIDRLTEQIARELEPMRKALLIYTRGARRLNQEAWRDAADDFTTVIDLGGKLRLAALLGRARCYARLERNVDAIADFDSILADPLAAPRLSASAWLDRGSLHWEHGRLEQAISDWGEVVHIADTEPLQRFRALEARGQTLEELGRWRLAADDYEAMATYSSIDPAYRSELRQTIVDLRRRATGVHPDT